MRPLSLIKKVTNIVLNQQFATICNGVITLLQSKLFTEYGLSEVFAGGQNDAGSTHHAIIGAIDMVSLVNGLDELFSSQEFKLFVNKVSNNRVILSRKTVFTLASFND